MDGQLTCKCHKLEPNSDCVDNKFFFLSSDSAQASSEYMSLQSGFNEPEGMDYKFKRIIFCKPISLTLTVQIPSVSHKAFNLHLEKG